MNKLKTLANPLSEEEDFVNTFIVIYRKLKLISSSKNINVGDSFISLNLKEVHLSGRMLKAITVLCHSHEYEIELNYNSDKQFVIDFKSEKHLDTDKLSFLLSKRGIKVKKI